MSLLQKALVLIILLCSVVGCSTPYQQKDFFGGFSETQLDTNVWRIRFNGNAFTSQDRVRDLSLMRACELALSTGYSYVAVISDKDQVEKSEAQIGSTSYSGTATCAGGTCSAIVNSYPPSKIPFTKYGSEQLVAFFRDRPENLFVIDARMSYRSLSSKYGIPARSFRTAPKASYTEAITRQSERQRSVNVTESRNRNFNLTTDDIDFDLSDDVLSILAGKIAELPVAASKNNISLARNYGYVLIYGQVENNLIRNDLNKLVKQESEQLGSLVSRLYNLLEVAEPISENQKRMDQNTAFNMLRDGELQFPQFKNRVKVFVSDGVVYLMGKLYRNDGEKIIEEASRYPDNNITRITSVIEWLD